MEENELDKSEQPTPFKLDRARKKGVVARGHDLGFFTGQAAFLGFLFIAAPLLGGALARMARQAWIGGPLLADGGATLLNASVSLLTLVARPVVLLAALLFVAVLLLELVQTGFVFSFEPLKPDFSRLNPANGLKRVFSVRALIETLKNICKLLLYTTLAFVAIRMALRTDLAAVSEARSFSSQLLHGATRLLGAFVAAAAFFALLDQILVRNFFTLRMRMSRRELRREAREREGEPRLKQKRKQLHREFTRTSQSLRNVRKADVLITNPQHLAVGLKYDARTMAAPTVVAVGVNQVAQRLKRMAFLYNVPIVQNPPLAQLLMRRTSLNGAIPDICYRPVADIYNTLRRRTAKGA
jgi:flagellar biosynthesis protein FlhB